MSLVLDTTNRADVADWGLLKSLGYVGVVRYLSPLQPNTDWKRITRAEADGLRAKHVPFELVWEYDADDWKYGGDSGEVFGRAAVRQATNLGYPQGSVLYGACDFDCNRHVWDTGASDYANGFYSAVKQGGYVAGVYGPWDVLQWCKGVGYTALWQCMSTGFSGGRNQSAFPGVRLRQIRGLQVANLDCDLNVSIDDFGTVVDAMDEQTAEDIRHIRSVIDAWRLGVDKSTDASLVAPVQWEGSMERWEKSISDAVAAINATLKTGSGSPDLTAVLARIDGLEAKFQKVLDALGKAI